jgi:WD40 repeat protein
MDVSGPVPDRVILVGGQGGTPITGCLLGDSLVLTAAHGLAEYDILIVIPATRERFQGKIAWSDSNADAALVRIEGSKFDGMPLLALGEIPSSPGATVHQAEALGFPRYAWRTEVSEVADEAARRGPVLTHVVGQVPAFSGVDSGEFEFDVSAPFAQQGGSSAWTGMSGAPVWIGGRLIGLLNRSDRDNNRLLGTRISRLLLDPLFAGITKLTPERVLVDASSAAGQPPEGAQAAGGTPDVSSSTRTVIALSARYHSADHPVDASAVLVSALRYAHENRLPGMTSALLDRLAGLQPEGTDAQALLNRLDSVLPVAEPVVAAASPPLSRLLELAADCAERVSGHREIHLRHLVAATVLADDPPLSPVLLTELRVSHAGLRRFLRDAAREEQTGESLEGWRALLQEATIRRAADRRRPSRILAEGQRVMAVALASAGLTAGEGPIALVGGENEVGSYHLGTGVKLGGYFQAGPIYSLTSVPETRQFLSGGRDGTVIVWDLGTTPASRELRGHTAQINGVAADLDGILAATASDDGTIRVWNLRPAQPGPVSVLTGAKGYANAVLFADVSGRSVVLSGNADGTLRAFALPEGTALWVADFAQTPIHAIALARYNGRPVVIAGQDSGECLMVSLDGGQLVVRFHAHDSPVRGIAAVNGSLIASVGGDGVVRLWNLDAQDLDSPFPVPDGELAYEAAGLGWSVAAARINDQLCVVSGHDRGALVWMLGMPGRPTAERPHTYFAGVQADVAQGEDRLGVSAEVNTLCDVVMAREVTPPLSVGLFGDWGTGKTFFMALMQKRIAQLAEASEQARLEGVETGLCVGVCQIEFNAWHYIDTNLWASLASKIFKQLATTDDRPDMQQMMQDLPSVRALRQNTEERRRQAEARLAAIDTELQNQEPVGLRDITVATLTEIRDSLPKQVGEHVDDVLEKAGVPKEKVEELDLRSTLPQMHEVGGRLIFLMQRGNWTVRLVLVLALALVVAGPPVLTLVLRQYLGDLTAALTSLITCLVAALLVARPYLNRASYFLKVAEDAVTNVDKQRQSVAQARREAFQRRIESIHTEIETLDAQIDSLNDIDSVQAYALKRLADDEYRRQEGLLALLRRDLEELSRRLAPPHPDDRTPGQSGPDTERIILYIDDLDRCPADRVVQVLQAIHLLLAFPLFVVIVGVDSRWLLRSLRTHYREVLGAPERRAHDSDNSGGEHWAATPQNYLEKIFQISLCLRPMSRSGYADLVTADIGRLIEDEDRPPADSLSTEAPPPAEAQIAHEDTSSEPDMETGRTGAPTAPPTAPEPDTKSAQPTMIHAFADRGKILAIAFSPRFSLTQPVLLSVTALGHITRRDLRRGGEILTERMTEAAVATAQLTIDDRILLIEEPALGGTGRFGRIVDSRTGEDTTTIDVSSDDGLFASNVAIPMSGKEIILSWADDDGRPQGHSAANAADRIAFDPAVRSGGVPLLLASSWRIVAEDDGSCYWMTNEPGSPPIPLQASSASRFITDQIERRFAAVGAAGLHVWSVGTEPVPVPLPRDLTERGSSPDIVAFGPNALLATAIDHSVKIWDLTAARLYAEVVTDSTVTAIAISTDGRRLAVGGDDGSIQLWLIAAPRRHEEFASEALRLTRSEATAIAAMEPLIRTPRSARRLINTYRLLRAGLRPDELDQLRSQDHGAVILLLAMLTAFPPQSADLLEQLISSTYRLPGTLIELIQSHLRTGWAPSGRSHHPAPSVDLLAWRRLATAVARVLAETSLQGNIDVYRRWAPHVARFSFRTGHLL